MSVNKNSIVRIGVYIDGQYFYKVSNYYKFDHPRQARISIPGLFNYIINEVAKNLGEDSDNCRITEAHYFRGRAIKSDNTNAIVGERYFEDALAKAGIQAHSLPLMRGPNNELREKGIDVLLALDAYKKAAMRAMDIFVLIAGDGDYLPLIRELQSMQMPGIPIDVLLLSWDFTCNNGDITVTSQDLLEEVKYPIQMATVINDRVKRKDPLVNGLFEPRQVQAGTERPAVTVSAPVQESLEEAKPAVTTITTARRKALTEAEQAQEREAVILSLNGNGGWLLDREYNNFYFSYSDVLNKKPEELGAGMKLRFHLKYDALKTEKDNEPSYRATGPIYAV
ncbi:MAG: NYN domain-containing protein [Treponema sp.]|jgi:uncharacterized LabA/DUF88 family protein|nr:NYN domain-containing protein [Treponema sp.]